MDFYEILKNNSLVNASLIISIGLIVWFTKKYLNTLDTNMKEHGKAIKDLYEKNLDLSKQFSELLGEHKARRASDHKELRILHDPGRFNS